MMTALIALVAGLAGGAAFCALPPMRWPRRRRGPDGHVHRFDTMRRDGVWRCGDCGERRVT